MDQTEPFGQELHLQKAVGNGVIQAKFDLAIVLSDSALWVQWKKDLGMG